MTSKPEQLLNATDSRSSIVRSDFLPFDLSGGVRYVTYVVCVRMYTYIHIYDVECRARVRYFTRIQLLPGHPWPMSTTAVITELFSTPSMLWVLDFRIFWLRVMNLRALARRPVVAGRIIDRAK